MVLLKTKNAKRLGHAWKAWPCRAVEAAVRSWVFILRAAGGHRAGTALVLKQKLS